MERLTSRQIIKHADGAEHIETYCHGHRYGPAAFPKKYGTSNLQEYKNYCEMVDRLADYEDIGLTPSEITKKLARLAELEKDIADRAYVKVIRCKDCVKRRTSMCRKKHEVADMDYCDAGEVEGR